MNSAQERLVVFAPTASGGHPEYVSALLGAVVADRPEAEIVWPVREDFDCSHKVRGASQPVAIAKMPVDDRTSAIVRFLWRLAPWRRHDLSFIRYLLCRQRGGTLLIEEHQRFTAILIVLAGKIMGMRLVFQLHNARRHDYTGGIFDRIDERMLGYALRRCDSVVVHTERLANVVRSRYGGVTTEVVSHGLLGECQSFEAPLGVPSVLFFGVNRPNKGLRGLVAALRLVEGPVRLVVAGFTANDYRRQTEEMLADVGDLEWVDRFVPDIEVDGIFQRTSVAVLPYSDFEAQSGVLHLAIAKGVPVVVTDVGALGETVKALGCGVVVPPGDPMALADAIERICDREINTRMRAHIRDVQDSLSWRTLGPRWAALLFRSSADD